MNNTQLLKEVLTDLNKEFNEHPDKNHIVGFVMGSLNKHLNCSETYQREEITTVIAKHMVNNYGK